MIKSFSYIITHDCMYVLMLQLHLLVHVEAAAKQALLYMAVGLDGPTEYPVNSSSVADPSDVRSEIYYSMLPVDLTCGS